MDTGVDGGEGVGIEADHGTVEKQEVGIGQQTASETDALHLAAGENNTVGAAEWCVPTLGQTINHLGETC